MQKESLGKRGKPTSPGEGPINRKGRSLAGAGTRGPCDKEHPEGGTLRKTGTVKEGMGGAPVEKIRVPFWRKKGRTSCRKKEGGGRRFAGEPGGRACEGEKKKKKSSVYYIYEKGGGKKSRPSRLRIARRSRRKNNWLFEMGKKKSEKKPSAGGDKEGESIEKTGRCSGPKKRSSSTGKGGKEGRGKAIPQRANKKDGTKEGRGRARQRKERTGANQGKTSRRLHFEEKEGGKGGGHSMERETSTVPSAKSEGEQDIRVIGRKKSESFLCFQKKQK